MPQASDELRERYLRIFPDLGCEHAVAELKKRGYALRRDWTWCAPHAGTTEEEREWIIFLIEEWDFGGIWEPAEVVRALESERAE